MNISIVAVHGLNPLNNASHAEATWTADNGKLWLRDFLPPILPTARILLFAYNSNVAFGTSTVGVREAADTLLDRLTFERKGVDSRPIVFVAHSLGGLVVKRALVSAKLNSAYEGIANATRGIAFFATPHQGGNGASIGDIAIKIANCIQLNAGGNLMETLKKNSRTSDELAEDFKRRLDDFQILTFFETLPLKPFGLASLSY